MLKRSLENSASIASNDSNAVAELPPVKETPVAAPSPQVEGSASSAPLPPQKKSGTKSKAVAPLGRRHDERYGRFE
jgi:hypothetical protein